MNLMLDGITNNVTSLSLDDNYSYDNNNDAMTSSNMTGLYVDVNASMATTATTSPPHVADVQFDKDSRIIVLWLQIIIGSLGGFLVLCWLYSNRKSRVNQLIFHVALSDLLVIFFSCLMQVIWEHYDRHWYAGDAMCKILKYLQCFPLLASTYMLIVLSVDRHQAIRAPLRKPFAVSRSRRLTFSPARRRLHDRTFS